MKTATATKSSIYQIVTDRILDSLKNGVIPWEKPWNAPTYAGGPFPRNFKTGREYRGINVLLLWSMPYSSPFWLTFKQAQELGGTVRKGEKGTQIVFYKQLTKRDATTEPKPTDAKEDRAPFVLTYFTVFNAEQCDGLKLPIMEPVAPRTPVEEDATCEALVSAWQNRPSLYLDNEAERRAYYQPSTDAVHMPTRSRFVDAPHFYATLFHELVHSTGHETRLARTFGEGFGTDLYAKEELVAETGAAFLCAITGIGNARTDRNTTAYLQNWISKLENDNRLIVTAAAAAQKAVDLITGYSYTPAAEDEGATGQAGAEHDPSFVLAAESLLSGR